MKPETRIFVAHWGRILTGAVVILIVAGGLLLLGGADPLTAFAVMLKGAFGTSAGMGETLIRFAPLALVALGLIPSLRIGLFNIGAPGQIGAGGLVAAVIVLNLNNLPAYIVLTVACVGAAVGGALCVLMPAVLRARFAVSENSVNVGVQFHNSLIPSIPADRADEGLSRQPSRIRSFPANAFLPTFAQGSRAHAGILLVFIAFFAIRAVDQSQIGYQLRLLGGSPSLAKQTGIKKSYMIVATLCLGGATAGIAGWMQAVGIDHRLYASIADPIGYTGLFAALMGGLTPIGVLISSFFFAALLRGGDSLQIGADVSPEIIGVLVGLIMLVMAAMEMTARRAEPAS